MPVYKAARPHQRARTSLQQNIHLTQNLKMSPVRNRPFLRRACQALATVLLVASMETQASAFTLTRAMVEEAQQAAPEGLRIEVLSAKTRVDGNADHQATTVQLEAKVTQVERSATHLKVGDTIRIEYTLNEPKHQPDITGGAGPDMPETLAVGAKCPAFLRRDSLHGSVYSPAARWLSFFDKDTLSR